MRRLSFLMPCSISSGVNCLISGGGGWDWRRGAMIRHHGSIGAELQERRLGLTTGWLPRMRRTPVGGFWHGDWGGAGRRGGGKGSERGEVAVGSQGSQRWWTVLGRGARCRQRRVASQPRMPLTPEPRQQHPYDHQDRCAE